jgi:hypothetical protein
MQNSTLKDKFQTYNALFYNMKTALIHFAFIDLNHCYHLNKSLTERRNRGCLLDLCSKDSLGCAQKAH